jgi:hypothetical protein
MNPRPMPGVFALPAFFTSLGRAAALGALLLAAAGAACSDQPDPRFSSFRIEKPGVAAQYDEKTGRLRKLEVDLNKDGRIDSWTYMDGARIDRIEIDADQNGVIERWEYYVDNKLDHVGTSRLGDGVVDQFAYQGASGALARVETDSDRDGKIDKWENFDPSPTSGGGPVLRSVALDPDESGKPTRRLLYSADGSFERAERLR